MRNKLAFFFAFLPLLALLCQDNNDTESFMARIKGEIETAREQAAAVRKATENQWNAHNSKMADIQGEADKLSNEIEALSNEIAELQLETQAAAQKAASLKRSQSQLDTLLNKKKDNATLAERMQDTIAEKESILQRLLAKPGTAIATEAVDSEGNIINGSAYHFGAIKIFEHNGQYAQLFNASNTGLPKVPGKLEPTLPPLEITGRHPELLAPDKGIIEHLRQGGIMMLPIIALGFICAFLVIFKLMEYAIKPLKLDLMQLEKIAAGSDAKGEKLEEELFSAAQQLLEKRRHWLFWLSVSASAAPLLGLLGTVTGMIHTFQLITIFGVGDARLLADGISEALITTEAGLCVAIPSLLCHAWLSRILKRHSSNLEAKITQLSQ